MSPGQIGFAGASYTAYIDNITVKTDTDNDGSHETTEIVETFPLNTADEMEDAFEYDAAGNLTFDGKAKYTYDAYNRLVMVQQAYKDPTVASGALQAGSTLGEYAYDAQGRRIRKDAYTADGLDNVEHFYYTGWSVVETRNGASGGGQVTQQHVWDNLAGHYIDSLAQVANNTNPTVDDEVDEDFYTLQDQQFNVLALTDDAGSIVERYEYTLYGERTVMNPQRVVRGDSAYGMVMGFQGLMHDVEIDAVQNRTRIYLPRLGIFGQQDIRGGLYPDGMNTYAAYHVMWGGLDPTGKKTISSPVVQIRSYIEPFNWQNEIKGVYNVYLTYIKKHGIGQHAGAWQTFSALLNALSQTANQNPNFKFENRGWLQAKFRICCENNKVDSAAYNMDNSHPGWTPKIAPSGAHLGYAEADAGKTLKWINKGSKCAHFFFESSSRIGEGLRRIGNLLANAGAGVQKMGAPWIWRRVSIKICCDKKYEITYKGSHFPTHDFYYNSLLIHTVKQSDLGKFMFTGDGVKAASGKAHTITGKLR